MAGCYSHWWHSLRLLLGIFISARAKRYSRFRPFPPLAVTARGDLAADERNNIEVFKRASPSVVHITTLAAARGFMRDEMQVPRGMARGFIWDAQGYVVTNFHVIQGASGAQVALSDHRTYPATLVGVFPDRDLAVLRIDVPADKDKSAADHGRRKRQPRRWVKRSTRSAIRLG